MKLKLMLAYAEETDTDQMFARMRSVENEKDVSLKCYKERIFSCILNVLSQCFTMIEKPYMYNS